MDHRTGFSFRSVELLVLLLMAGMAGQADAVPSYARQTGQECIACHVSFPELTPYGRYFKLTGYTIGKAFVSSEGLNYVPLAVMAQASVTNTKSNHATDPATGDAVTVNQRNNSAVFLALACSPPRSTITSLGFIQWSSITRHHADGTLGVTAGLTTPTPSRRKVQQPGRSHPTHSMGSPSTTTDDQDP
jgi:hypothetical protein